MIPTTPSKELSAMQELIDFIQLHFKWFIEHSPDDGVVPLILKKAERLLEKEQDQHEETHYNGQIAGGCKHPSTSDFNSYFNNKYGTP